MTFCYPCRNLDQSFHANIYVVLVVLVVTLGGNQSGASKDKRSIVWLIPVTSYAYRMRVIKDSRWRTGSEKIKNKDETGSP